METANYDTERKSKLRKRSHYLLSAGVLIMLGGGSYSIINSSTQPSSLERYEIASDSNSTQVRRNYEPEPQVNERIGYLIIAAGGGFTLSSMIWPLLSRRRQAKTDREYAQRDLEVHND